MTGRRDELLNGRPSARHGKGFVSLDHTSIITCSRVDQLINCELMYTIPNNWKPEKRKGLFRFFREIVGSGAGE